jgi:O-antigen/teichoic acid export membrane protein
MSLWRVTKTGSALMSGQGINVITQLVLPPIFLHHYGVSTYGEWLALSATVSYLATLNFGLQTFANNQVAIHFNRGEFEEANTIQSTALLLLLVIVASAALITAVVFFLPINSWLQLKMDAFSASATVYMLGLQILVRILFGFLVGIFLVVGISYRGGYWNNFLAIANTAATAVMAFRHASFTWIAAQQTTTVVVFGGLVLIDLRRRAPGIFPRLRYASPRRFGEVLKPSGYFGLLYSSNFLVYQVPVILLQRMLGPTTVVVFSLTRTVFSMARAVLNSMTQAIGPEITEFYGKRNWPGLFRLYELSERVIFALIPPVTLGTLVATPLLMAVWLHKPGLYHPYVCLVMALISGVMAIKEHKYVFQTSSNQHTMLARSIFWSYVVMVALDAPAIHWFGILGFLGVWFATELFQVLAILHLNQRLFANVSRVDFSPVYKLFALMGGATILGIRVVITAGQRSLPITALTALLVVAVLLVIGYPLFGLREVRSYLRSRVAISQRKPA